MSVISALYSGISGIIANGEALSVAGDNIANMNTPGFKSSSAIFESSITQQLGSAQIGLGSDIAATTSDFSKGAFVQSTQATDLAIDGDGFFVVQSSAGNQGYTRAGSFVKDSNGNLTTASGGYQLLGQSIDPTTGATSPALAAINLLSVSALPQATSILAISANLNSSTPIRSDTFSAVTSAAANTTSDFQTSTSIYDSLGNARQVTTYFRHTGANTWTYHATTPGTNLSNAGPAGQNPVVLEEGTLTFSSTGTFLTQAKTNISPLDGRGGDPDGGTALQAGERINPALTAPESEIQWANGAAAVASIDFDFGAAPNSSAVMTQVSAASTVNGLTQDGRQSGSLTTIAIGQDGTITGSFSNGSSRPLFKIPLALFPNEEGLSRIGNNIFAESALSGIHQISLAQTGGRGPIDAGRLEQSNVDIASEFVKVITFQRAFQASSRTVSTAAELLQDLVRLGS